ncbi:hypothetical protein MADA3029_1010021 [Vibrio nigripulchritudo MADA3029]|uniref:hypothetical protein n=1 Tax=Vibrio nigripulchritudo TaxID=28173 RepID=UPI0003B236C9|nr:hypothetical protein [Vibrio nigripulchritudo]CCN48942.1 hypothetical protein VIBNIMADA3020_660021 [Vibrio nigripulchritudo MADA3020]CCN53228.1 hypothetical protein VIBNIMADA3021_220021 [Vibrio nigripulchritudo MADA3021]CCN56830.1 hypothetical protein MADA3029_1010021 [Vibrio nigripulchritudo MADA3029]
MGEVKDNLPQGSSRNKIEYLAEAIDNAGGFVVATGHQLPATGDVFGLINPEGWREGFRPEHARQFERYIFVTNEYAPEMAISGDYGATFHYRTLPIEFREKAHFWTSGRTFQIGMNPCDTGAPILAVASDGQLHISKNLGATWVDLTDKLKNLKCVKTNKVFSALGYDANDPSVKPSFTVAVDGNLIVVSSLNLNRVGGWAVSFDGGETFKGVAAFGADGQYSFVNAAGGANTVIDMVVRDGATPYFAFVSGRTPAVKVKIAGVVDHTIETINAGGFILGDFHCTLTVDAITDDIYLFDHNSGRSYSKLDFAKGTYTKADFPANPHGLVWTVARWSFGGCWKTANSWQYVENGKLIFGRMKSNYHYLSPLDGKARGEICELNLETGEVTVLTEFIPVQESFTKHNYYGAITRKGDQIFVTVGSAILRSSDGGKTWTKNEGEMVGLFLNVDGRWLPTMPILDKHIPSIDGLKVYP